MIEDLEAVHADSIRVKSAEEIASETSFEQISPDMERKVLDQIAKQNGINADSLNISPSKFKKFNKVDLCEAIKRGAPSDDSKEGQSKPNEKEEGFDLIGFGLTLYSVAMEAKEKKSFKKLDSFVASTVTERLNKDDNRPALLANDKLLTRMLLSAGMVYVLGRAVGFDTITDKANAIKDKILGKRGTPVNEPHSK